MLPPFSAKSYLPANDASRTFISPTACNVPPALFTAMFAGVEEPILMLAELLIVAALLIDDAFRLRVKGCTVPVTDSREMGTMEEKIAPCKLLMVVALKVPVETWRLF